VTGTNSIWDSVVREQVTGIDLVVFGERELSIRHPPSLALMAMAQQPPGGINSINCGENELPDLRPGTTSTICGEREDGMT